MGFGATMCRYVADRSSRRQWDELNQVVSSINAIYCTMAGVVVLCAGGLSLLAPLVDRWGDQPVGEIQLVIMLQGLSTAIGMLGSVYGGVLIGGQRMDLKQSIETGSALVRFGLIFSLLSWRPSLTSLSLVFLLVTIVENWLLYLLAHRTIPTLSVRFAHFRKPILKECFGFTSYSALALIAEQLIFMTDTIVIGLCLGTEAVVPYAIALRICQMAQSPLAKIGEAMLPKAGELHATGQREKLAMLTERMAGLSFVLIGGGFIGCYFFADMLLHVWVAAKDPQWTAHDSHTSLWVLIILLGAQVVAQPLVVLRKTLLGMGNVRLPALIDLGEAGINLVLSLLFVFTFGAVGVAWGTFIPLVLVELLVLLPYANREIGTSGQRLARNAILPQLPALLALLTYCWTVSHLGPSDRWINLLGIAAGGGAVLGVTWIATNHLLKRRRQAVPAAI
jgi:O-antigen/teichoic acid export membrane protein